MSNESRPNPASSRWPEAIAVVLSVIALLVSGYALIAAQRQHEDERTTELLDQIYEDWDQMQAGDLWEVSHLAEVPGTYAHTRDVLREYASQLTPQEQRRLYLLERATALRIFNWFELHFRQWRRARGLGDEGREAMLQEEVGYWTDEYLRNPRLLWYYSPEGGNIMEVLDPPTVEFYRERVLGNPDVPLTEQPDPDGILPRFLPGGSSEDREAQ